MVVFELFLKIVTENAAFIKVNPNDYQWMFDIECGKCFKKQPNEISFSGSDKVDTEKGHSTVNFSMKCKECKSIFTIEIQKSSKFKIELETGNDEGVLARFECRGVNLIEFYPTDEIIIEASESGTEFMSNLNEPSCEYDEKTGNMINVLEAAEWRLATSKK